MKKPKKMSSNKFVRFSCLWLAGFVVLFSFMVGDYFYYFNYLEVFPSELILPLLIIFTLSLIIALIAFFLPWPKLFQSKLLVATVLAFSMNNYDGRMYSMANFFRGLIPILPAPDKDLPIITVFYFALLTIMAVIFGILTDKLLSKKNQYAHRFTEFLLVFLAVLGLWQLLHISSVLPTILKESKVTPAPLSASQVKTIQSKPDIYYIVLDRYTNSNVLKNQFDFDNTKFLNDLKSKGFVVNDNANSNYPLTSISISSTLNANYTNDIVKPFKNNVVQSRTLYHNLIRQSSVIKLLKDNGYTFYQIGSDYGASNKAPMADSDLSSSNVISVFGVTKKLRSFELVQFNKSPYRQLFKTSMSWWPLKSVEKDKIKYIGDQFAALNNLANQPTGNPKFVFSHILLPHDPFVFNKDGSISAYQATDNYGTTVKDKYLNQLQYVNKEISKTVSNILKSSNGQAVILLNADEGSYPQDMNSDAFDLAVPLDYMSKSDMSAWPEDWLKMKFGILQAVHIPKASQNDLQNLSSVNLFRIVLNNYLGYKFDYLPDCSYGFSNGDRFEYYYKDITAKLKGSPNNQCLQYQSLK